MRTWQIAGQRRNAKALACWLPAYAKIVRVNRGDDVEQPGNDDELGSVVGSCHLNRAVAEVHNPPKNVERAAAKISRKAKHLQHIAHIGLVQLALHHDAEGEHTGDRDEEERCPDPVFCQYVTETRNEPAENERSICQTGRFLLQLCTYLNFRCHHFDYTARPRSKPMQRGAGIQMTGGRNQPRLVSTSRIVLTMKSRSFCSAMNGGDRIAVLPVVFTCNTAILSPTFIAEQKDLDFIVETIREE